MINVNIKNFDLLSPKFERENIKLGLSRVKKALGDLGEPCKNIPAIQVVGTNGKGSITAFIENILCVEKKNVGEDSLYRPRSQWRPFHPFKGRILECPTRWARSLHLHP